MECNRAGEMMSLAIDRMLSNEEVKELQEHLDMCDLCREEYELFQSIQSALKSEEAASLPENFHNELMHRIENETIEEEVAKASKDENNVVPLAKPFYKRLNFRQFNLAAAAVLILIIGIFGINSFDRHQTLNESGSVTMSTSDASKDMMAESTMDSMSESAMVESVSEESFQVRDVDEESQEREALHEESAPAPATLKAREVDETADAKKAEVMKEESNLEENNEMNDDGNEIMMAKDTESSEMTIKMNEEPEQIQEEILENEVSLPFVILSIVVGIGALIGAAIVIFRKLR